MIIHSLFFMNGSKLPHTLRLTVLILRIALGVNFFYLGFSALFSPGLEKILSERSLTDFYAWLAIPANSGSLGTFFSWAFLFIGACLIVGLFTRFVSAGAFVLTLFTYIPGMMATPLTLSQFVNDEVIVAACLLVLIFANAGSYLGIDTFIHIHLASRHNKK